jgi:hypothetical protein
VKVEGISIYSGLSDELILEAYHAAKSLEGRTIQDVMSSVAKLLSKPPGYGLAILLEE